MSEELKLLPCPFCGGEAETCKGERGDGSLWLYLACSRCEAMAPYGKTLDDQKAAWSTRPAPVIDGEMVEKGARGIFAYFYPPDPDFPNDWNTSCDPNDWNSYYEEGKERFRKESLACLQAALGKEVG